MFTFWFNKNIRIWLFMIVWIIRFNWLLAYLKSEALYSTNTAFLYVFPSTSWCSPWCMWWWELLKKQTFLVWRFERYIIHSSKQKWSNKTWRRHKNLYDKFVVKYYLQFLRLNTKRSSFHTKFHNDWNNIKTNRICKLLSDLRTWKIHGPFLLSRKWINLFLQAYSSN